MAEGDQTPGEPLVAVIHMGTLVALFVPTVHRARLTEAVRVAGVALWNVPADPVLGENYGAATGASILAKTQ